MIISHKYKFIFIKQEKTAGSSLEIALSKYCGLEDIVTTITEEYIRKKLGYPGPRNYFNNQIDYKNFLKIFKHNLKSFIKNIKLTKKIIKFKNQPYYKTFYKSIFYEHINAFDLKSIVDKDIWNNYYKFTIIRDPVDHFLSYYCHMNNEQKLVEANPIKVFADKKCHPFFKRTRKKYYINNKIVIDKFVDFANFEEDINFIGNKLKINNNLYQDFKNISANTQYRKNVKVHLDPLTRKVIQNNSQDLQKLYFSISSK